MNRAVGALLRVVTSSVAVGLAAAATAVAATLAATGVIPGAGALGAVLVLWLGACLVTSMMAVGLLDAARRAAATEAGAAAEHRKRTRIAMGMGQPQDFL